MKKPVNYIDFFLMEMLKLFRKITDVQMEWFFHLILIIFIILIKRVILLKNECPQINIIFCRYHFC